ncbi:MAG: DUF4249 domain-containing protein [Crocinitomicaceae bacterium]|nr:DUF4249 domain-containing protein [Crocinitomicaceae bacterium]
MKFLLPTILVFLIALCSCSKEVEIDIPGYVSELVVDGTIETNQHPLVLLSTSADIYSATDLSSYLTGFVYDAEVEIICENDTFDLQLYNIADLPLQSQYKLAEMLRLKKHSEILQIPIMVYSNTALIGEINKDYTLRIRHNNKSYVGTTKIVPPTPLDSIYWKLEPETIEYGYSWAILSDTPNQFDGYKWEVKRTNLKSNGLPKDDIFKRGRGGYFDDQYFDGISFEFFYENPMNRKDSTHLKEYKRYYRLGDTVVVKFSKMDEYVFTYYDAKLNQIVNSGNPFSTPINAPSNMSDGALGVWAGYSPYYDTLYCYP